MSLTVRSDAKVFRNGEMLFGFTSSFRMGQLLRYGWKPPGREVAQDHDEYLHTTFIESVRARFKAGGYARTKDGADAGGTFLVIAFGRVLRVDDDFQIGESVHRFDAVGCGSDIALGSLLTSANFDWEPRRRIEMALTAAAEFSGGVRAPFVVEEWKAE